MDQDACFINTFFCSLNLASALSAVPHVPGMAHTAAFPPPPFLKSRVSSGNPGFSEQRDFVLSQPDLEPIEAIERFPLTAMGFVSDCQRVPPIAAPCSIPYYV